MMDTSNDAPDVRSVSDRPLAAIGLTSYRCRSRFGWIMIGAKDDDDALVQALRSCESARRDALQRWNGQTYVNVDFDTEAATLDDATAHLRMRERHYDRLYYMKRLFELESLSELDSCTARILGDTRAIVRGDAPLTRMVDLSDAVCLAELEAFEVTENERHNKPYWEPHWSRQLRIDTARSVSDAMDRYYKPDRLDRPGGTRERLIADREQELQEKGFACVASYHDSVNGQGVYLRSLEDGLSIWSAPRR